MDLSTAHNNARIAACRLPALNASLALLVQPDAGQPERSRIALYGTAKPAAGLPPSVFGAVAESGTTAYDEATYPIENNAGTIAQTWTITITDHATGAFKLDGSTLGADVATGNLNADFAPVNPAGGVYFTLRATGWGGTAATNDTLTFTVTLADPIVALPLSAAAGAVDAGLFQIQLDVPVEAQITGADPAAGTIPLWARIADYTGAWWADATVSVVGDGGEIQLDQTGTEGSPAVPVVRLFNGAFARLTSAVFQG